MLQPWLPDATVLDLFAGSGALGLEALSRGAKSAVFCDVAGAAIKAVRANISALGVMERARCLHMNWEQALKLLMAEAASFDLVLLDPPYEVALPPILAQLVRSGLLAPDSLVMAEHDAQQQISTPAGLGLYKHRRYGDSAISIFMLEGRQDAHSDFSRQL